MEYTAMPLRTLLLQSLLAPPLIAGKPPSKTALVVHGLAAAVFVAFVSVV
jgi:hypothetical protein